MAVVTDVAKTYNILTENYEADGSLTSLQYCGVAPSGASSGKVKVAAPGGQGVLTMGILQNAPADGELAEVMEEGVSKAVANSSFNSGEELTVAGTSGKLDTASSGDYVIAIAREAANAANHEVSVRIVSPYQLN
jgi:hypothetical protein